MNLRNLLGTLGSALFCSFCYGALPAAAEPSIPQPVEVAQANDTEPEISPSFRTKAERLFEVSGGRETGRAIVPAFVQQILQQLQQVLPTQVSPQAATIVAEETTTFFDKNFDALIEAAVPIYAKYYTEDDLDALIEFYESPVGQKFVATAPALSQDSFQLSQRWFAERQPEFLEQLRSRLEAEGLL